MIQKTKKILVIFIFCCASFLVKAQQYKYKADINHIPENSFYHINISPQLSAHLKTDFTDFRIFNEKGEQVQGNFMDWKVGRMNEKIMLYAHIKG